MLTQRSRWALVMTLSLLALPFSGCNSSPLGGSCTAGEDTDADGLTNDKECALGTDPNSADSDGDGFLDGDEVARGTDPSRSDSIPPRVPGCVGPCTVNYNCPAAQGPTTISGTVFIPSGSLPLYNAKVYIPTGDAVPPPPTTGATCDRCDANVDGFSTTTDINGNFTLTNVPHGQNIPLIIKVGKWRRVITIPAVNECAVTPLAATETRLPRNQSEGNIPKIALSTGSADALECILRRNKLGLDDSEFTVESGNGRVNLYGGATGANRYTTALGGANFTSSQNTPAASWWDTPGNWNKYDIVMLSCEGGQYTNQKSAAARTNLENYVNAGGRVFASHWHNGWFVNSTPPQKLQTVAQFGNDQSPGTITAQINTNFTKGSALADWLVLPAVWGTGTPPTRGTFPVGGARITISNLTPALTQLWVSTTANAPQYFSFNAPIGAGSADQCGQMVFTDLHVSSGTGGDSSAAGTPFPNGCTANALSAQEKALIFMLFDLTNCLQPPIG